MQRRSIYSRRTGRASPLVSCFARLSCCARGQRANAEMKPLNPFAAEVAPAETAPATSPPSAFAAPSTAQQSPGAFSGIFGWVLRTQQSLQRDLATGVKSLKGEHAIAGAFMLAALSFIYGVVHAVGPGHGKTIISSYVVANEETVRRGVIISFIAAGLQALTAIALVGILAFALNASGMQINAWSNQLEMVSYALIALVGAWLLTTQLIAIFRRWQESHAAEAQCRARRHTTITIMRTVSTTITILMPMTTIMVTAMRKARPAIISSMRASLPARSPGARSSPWCSRSASGHAPGRSSCSSSR